MNKNLKFEWLNSKNLSILLLLMGLVYVITTNLVGSRFKEIELNTRAQISAQQALLSTIAEITARNGADAVTESIVRDCPMNERVEFDDLLGRLDNDLLHRQLTKLERLFGRCGSFSSDRKAVMVSRLSRETEIYQNLVNQLSIVMSEDMSLSYNVEKWTALATAERKQSEFFTQLVQLQDRIISQLLVGKTVKSAETVGVLREVTEVKEALLYTNQQASSIRAELIPL